jgi:hypothetical protein
MKTKIKNNTIKGFVVVAGLTCLNSSAFAQRDAPNRDERRQQRQQERAGLTPEQRQQNFQARMQERMRTMTPEQRQRMQERMQQWQEQNGGQGGPGGPGGPGGNWQGQGGGPNGQGAATAKADQMRAAMIAAGILETPVQDEIIAFILRQERVRASLLLVAQNAAQALIKPTTQGAAVVQAAVDGAPAAVDVAVANADVERTLVAYETALQAEKVRYTDDLKALDEKVSFSTTPRIKAFLSLVGVLSFEPYTLGGPEVIFSPPGSQLQGRQGRGGRNRGNQGQEGGAGQPQANEADAPAQPTAE